MKINQYKRSNTNTKKTQNTSKTIISNENYQITMNFKKRTTIPMILMEETRALGYGFSPETFFYQKGKENGHIPLIHRMKTNSRVSEKD